nr:hypothetical protein Docile-S101_00056 [Bovine alphaherpesvirus 1]
MTTCTLPAPRRAASRSTSCALAVASIATIRGHRRSSRCSSASTRCKRPIVGEYNWARVDMTSSSTSIS